MYEQGYRYNTASRSLGQNFLVDIEVARAEAAHSYKKNVLELGPGYGVLTKELCRHANRVVAVEKDYRLYMYLKSNVSSRRLKLINRDFFDAGEEELGLAATDIMISNIPYSLSSKTIEWLYAKKMEAVLCLQREFVEHMLAGEDSSNYSRLSVMCSLSFSVTRIMDVSRGCFQPVPKVDSTLIFIKPKDTAISETEKDTINALMQHKKNTVRKAVLASRSSLNADKGRLARIADRMSEKDRRLFKMKPVEILASSRELISYLNE